FAPVDEGDRRATGCRIRESGVVPHHPKVLVVHLDFAQVHRANRVVGDGEFVSLLCAVIGDRKGVARHSFPLARSFGEPTRPSLACTSFGWCIGGRSGRWVVPPDGVSRNPFPAPESTQILGPKLWAMAAVEDES